MTHDHPRVLLTDEEQAFIDDRRALSRGASGFQSNIYIDDDGEVVKSGDSGVGCSSDADWEEDSNCENIEVWKLLGLITFRPSTPVLVPLDMSPFHLKDSNVERLKEAELSKAQKEEAANSVRNVVIKDCVSDLNYNCGVLVKVMSSDNLWQIKHLVGNAGDESNLSICDVISSPYVDKYPYFNRMDSIPVPGYMQYYKEQDRLEKRRKRRIKQGVPEEELDNPEGDHAPEDGDLVFGEEVGFSFEEREKTLLERIFGLKRHKLLHRKPPTIEHLIRDYGDLFLACDAFAEIYPQHKYMIVNCLRHYTENMLVRESKKTLTTRKGQRIIPTVTNSVFAQAAQRENQRRNETQAEQTDEDMNEGNEALSQPYVIGTIGGPSSADIGHMTCSHLSIVLSDNGSTDIARAAADIVIPVSTVAKRDDSMHSSTIRDELSTFDDNVAVTGLAILPKAIQMARIGMQRISIVVSYKVSNLICLAFLNMSMVLFLTAQSDVSITRSHVVDAVDPAGNTELRPSTQDVVTLPLACVLISMFSVDLICYYTLTNPDHTISSEAVGEADYEMGLISQKMHHYHISNTRSVTAERAELINSTRKVDEIDEGTLDDEDELQPFLQFVGRDGQDRHRVKRKKSKHIAGEDFAISPSKFPDRLDNISLSRFILGLVVALTYGLFSCMFIFFVTRSNHVIVNSNYGYAFVHYYLSIHGILQHNGNITAVIMLHLYITQLGVFLSLYNGKDWMWRRSGWRNNKNLINIIVVVGIFHAFMYTFLPKMFAYDIYDYQIKRKPLGATGFVIESIGSMVLIAVLGIVQCVCIDCVKLFVMYQLRKHTAWSHVAMSNVMRYPTGTLEFIAGKKHLLAEAARNYLINTQPPPPPVIVEPEPDPETTLDLDVNEINSYPYGYSFDEYGAPTLEEGYDDFDDNDDEDDEYYDPMAEKHMQYGDYDEYGVGVVEGDEDMYEDDGMLL